MALSNEVVLRPRFQEILDHPAESILKAFQNAGGGPYVIKRVDDHVFIRMSQEQMHFWSPQLQLEIEPISEETSKIYGLFGPNPTLWSFFMFLHFGVAVAFIILGIWAYSSMNLNQSARPQLTGMVILVLGWAFLYIAGRTGKAKGKPQMRMLMEFYRGVLREL